MASSNFRIKIMDDIILSNARAKGIQIQDIQLNQLINNIAKQNDMTMQDLRDELAYQNFYFTIYQNIIRKYFLLSSVRNEAMRYKRKVLPLDKILMDFNTVNAIQNYDVNISYILLTLPDIYTQYGFMFLGQKVNILLNNGDKFNNLAKNSANDSQALKGGNIGTCEFLKIAQVFWIRISIKYTGDKF